MNNFIILFIILVSYGLYKRIKLFNMQEFLEGGKFDYINIYRKKK